MERNKILYAEDKDGYRNDVKKFILEEFPGYEVEEHKSGQSLNRRLKEDIHDVALVITDGTMSPGPKGKEIIRTYANRMRSIPFILLSGDGDFYAAMDCGAFGAIFKRDANLIKKLSKTIGDALEFSKQR